MKALSIEEANKLPITSLYLAIVYFPVSPENLPNILQQIPPETAASKSIEKFNKAVNDSVESLAVDGKIFGMDQSEYVDSFQQLLCSLITTCLATPLVKTDDGEWINVGKADIDLEGADITCLESFNNYYNEREYHFEELDGRTVLYVDNYVPFEEYKSKYLPQDNTEIN